MRSVVSFEMNSNWTLDMPLVHGEPFFPQSFHLTHIRITFMDFDDCISLFYHLGSQLHSLFVDIGHVSLYKLRVMSQMPLVKKAISFEI